MESARSLADKFQNESSHLRGKLEQAMGGSEGEDCSDQELQEAGGRSASRSKEVPADC